MCEEYIDSNSGSIFQPVSFRLGKHQLTLPVFIQELLKVWGAKKPIGSTYPGGFRMRISRHHQDDDLHLLGVGKS